MSNTAYLCKLLGGGARPPRAPPIPTALFRALSRVYTQLKDGRGEGEYVLIFFIKIGSGDKKKRSIICQSL